MNPIVSQQAALDNSLVALKKRLKIERCNARIAFTKLQKEETYQVTLEAPKLSPCYPAFQITAEVPEIYMHQFWNTIKKIGNINAYNFKLDKKKCRVDTESHLSKSLDTLAIMKCYLQYILIKCTSLGEHLLLSLTGASLGNQQDLIGSGYNLNNVNYVALPWEDFMYQADNRETSSSRKEHMPYPRFTKVIINHFISKDNTIFMRNMINLHTVRDDSLLGRKLKKLESPKHKTILASPKEPTQKGKRVKRPAKKATTALTTSVVIRDTPGKSVSKKKAQLRLIELLSDAAQLEDIELKKILRKSKQESHKLQASGSSEGANFESKFIDEQIGKTKNTSEGTGVKPGVLDVSKEDSSDSDDDSWGNSEEESDDFNDEDDNDVESGNNDDNGYDDGGNDAEDSVQMDLDNDENPSFTLRDYDEEEQDEEYVHTSEKDKSDDEENMYEEEDDDAAKELYEDLNISQGLRDTDMTNVEQGREDPQNASHESGFVQQEDDGHVTLTTVHDKTEGPLQSSSVSSNFTSKLLNLDDPSPDINSLMNT
nr:hypothetical protein [Tanacetum cinerariifolium]